MTSHGKKFWGSKYWVFLHLIAINYNPSHFNHFSTNIVSQKDLLPCMECRINFAKKLQKHDISKWSSSPEKMSQLFYMFHDEVNNYYNQKNPDKVPKSSPPLNSVVKYYKNLSSTSNWIPSFWNTCYCIAASYSNDNYESAKNFFSTLPFVLFSDFRNDFSNLLERYPIDNYLQDNHSLFFWVFLLDDAYSKKYGIIGKNYNEWKRFIFDGLGDDCKQCQM